MAMPRRVLLVNPPPYQYVEPYYDLPDYPRTGIAYLAGFLRQNGMDIHVLDCKFDRLKYAEGIEKVKRLQPDIVGFGAFTNEIKQASTFARLVKQLDPKITTIIGGVHVSALPETTLREFPEFDFGVVGEGEQTLLELVKAEKEQCIQEGIRGVCFIDERGHYQFGGERQRILDQDALSWPAWDMFRPAKEYILHTSRGCPYACNFCMNPNGRIVRPRSPENVLNEIEWLQRLSHPKSLLFGDEIYTVKRDRVMEITRGFIDRGYHKRTQWWCQTHVRCIDLELAHSMKASNCNLVGLGIESGDEERLKSMGKGTNVQTILEAVKVVKRAKLPFMTFFILGQPNETVESAKNTIRFAIKLNPTRPILGLMVPYPGTKIAEMAAKGEGGYVLLSNDWNEYNKQFGNALEFKNFSRKQLERLQFFGYLKVFILNLRFWDLLKFIWTYRVEGIAVIKKQFRFIVEESFVFTAFRPDAMKKQPAVR